MKRIIILLLLFVTVNIMAQDIEPDKAIHFTAITGLYILSDVFCEWVELPKYIPFVLCTGVSLGKELHDPVFNWKDIAADGIGISAGFAIRFADIKNF